MRSAAIVGLVEREPFRSSAPMLTSRLHGPLPNRSNSCRSALLTKNLRRESEQRCGCANRLALAPRTDPATPLAADSCLDTAYNDDAHALCTRRSRRRTRKQFNGAFSSPCRTRPNPMSAAVHAIRWPAISKRLRDDVAASSAGRKFSPIFDSPSGISTSLECRAAPTVIRRLGVATRGL